jgi:hypothetical protein
MVILVAGKDVAKEVQLTTQYFPDPPVTGVIPEAGTCPLPLGIARSSGKT